MIKLIKWQLLEYRSSFFSAFMVVWLCAAVAAWLSHTLLGVSLNTVVTVFRLVQWFSFLTIAWIRYADVGLLGSASIRDACSLPLHVPQPRWCGLMAKLLGLLPMLLGYVAINAMMFRILPHDLPQLAELSPHHALFRATGPILWGAVITNALIVRTRLTGVLCPPWSMRFLGQFPKLRSWLYAWLHVMTNVILAVPYALVAGGFSTRVVAADLPVPLPALIVATVGLLLTFANGYLLERYTPQLEPWA